MIHFVSERVENDVILYIDNGENESSGHWMGRNPRFEKAMSHSSFTLELNFKLGNLELSQMPFSKSYKSIMLKS